MAPRRRSASLSWLLVAALAAGWLPARTSAGEVTITSPPARTPVFGEVTVAVRVRSEETVESVVILVDGGQVVELRQAPYRWIVDVGQENQEHRFVAEAHGREGVVGRAVLVTPPITVDEQIHLDLQQVYVTVTRNGRRVRDLRRSQFALRDQGRPQQIVNFAHGNIPFTAVVLIDASSSMEGAKMAAVRRGARAFVAGMREHDEVRLMVFSDRLVTASPFSHRADPLLAALALAEAEGGTAINDFLSQALCELEARQGRRVALVLSDGEDIHSVLDMPEVRELARRSQAQLYWLRAGEKGAGDSPPMMNSWRNRRELNQQLRSLAATVTESGGRVIPIRADKDVEAAFAEVLSELRDQYALGYYPQPRRNDLSWRALEVTVDGPGLKPRTREGYVDW